MITAISGRKGSGKSTISKVLLSTGYQKISFADYLKNMLKDICNVPIDYFQDQDLKQKNLLNIKIDSKFINLISEYINEKFSNEIYEMHDEGGFLIKEKEITTPRSLLQYVGTNILRKHNKDFHAIKTYEKITNNPDINFVCDDLRFPNELDHLKLAAKKINTKCKSFFIIRPDNFDISNHESEISLNFCHLDKLIINDSSEEMFLQKFQESYDKYDTDINNTGNYNLYYDFYYKPINLFIIIGFMRQIFNFTKMFPLDKIKGLSSVKILYLMESMLDNIYDTTGTLHVYYPDLLLNDIKLFLVDDYYLQALSQRHSKSSYKDAFNLGMSLAIDCNKHQLEHNIKNFFIKQ